jgi:iron complex outermembrane receptor protein
VQPTAYDLGEVDLVGTPLYPARPDLPTDGPRSHDAVDQRTFSLGYAGVFGGRLELRAGLHRTTYSKRFEPVAGPASELERSFWLEHGSALWRFDERTAAFASYVKGLEDSGVAPQTAVNRGQVLPPVQSRQIEIGLRRQITPKVGLIAAAFDVSKPMPGLRADGIYGLVGDVRHRGVELSVNGALTPSTQLVLGVMAMRPRISGALVDAGLVGAEPPGVSSVVAVAGLDQTLGFLPGLSVDGQLSWESGRWADTADSFKTPPLTQLSLGARYRFDVEGRPATFRIAASNVLGASQWRAFPYGAMYPVNPPLLRASLTMTFAPPAAPRAEG